jgi:hypothetical protein
MSEKEPKDGLGFNIKFKIGKEEYHVTGEGMKKFTDTIDEIELVQQQAHQKAEDKRMLKRVVEEAEG